MLRSGVPEEVARHAAAVLAALFFGFLSVYVALRAREKRSPGLARWTGPVSVGWVVTNVCALLLILLTFWGLNLHHRLSQRDLLAALPKNPRDLEAERARHGLILLKASILVLPAIAAVTWLATFRWARRLDPPPGRHSSTVLWGLLVSAAGLGIFLLVYGDLVLG